MGTPLTVDAVRTVLERHPNIDKRELLARLIAEGVSIADTSTLNAFLYQHRPSVFDWRPGPGAGRLWYAIRGTAGVAAAPATQPDAPVGLDLYRWQRKALAAWAEKRHRGVVEAVTGAGKTRLALQAILDAASAGRKVAVIVPTLELMRQWRREIDIHVQPRVSGALKIGALGGGNIDDLRRSDIVVASAASASKWQILYGSDGLLVADECHHYGAAVWSNAMEVGFGERLGLTATYEREDNGVEEYLDPYFGGVCYSVGYQEALADGVIAPFRIAFIGVALTPTEADTYEDAAEKAGRYRRRLVSEWGLTPEPFGAFIREVQQLRHAGVAEGSRLAGFYLAAFAKRRQVMAESSGKVSMLRQIAPAVGRSQRTIVFAQTVLAAQGAIQTLRGAGHRGAVIEASLDEEDRKDAFSAFERGDLTVVAAPKLLDEGVDVPAADLAIVLATSRSRRQLIQRMGRVVRKKADGRAARIAILYAENTAEDPASGAHEDFLDVVVDAASEVRFFRGASSSALIQYLSP